MGARGIKTWRRRRGVALGLQPSSTSCSSRGLFFYFPCVPIAMPAHPIPTAHVHPQRRIRLSSGLGACPKLYADKKGQSRGPWSQFSALELHCTPLGHIHYFHARIIVKITSVFPKHSIECLRIWSTIGRKSVSAELRCSRSDLPFGPPSMILQCLIPPQNSIPVKESLVSFRKLSPWYRCGNGGPEKVLCWCLVQRLWEYR